MDICVVSTMAIMKITITNTDAFFANYAFIILGIYKGVEFLDHLLTQH